MRSFRRTVVGVAIAVLVLLVLFPPYYGIMSAPEGDIHSPLGFYPIWDPPTTEECRERLREIFRDSPEAGVLAQSTDLTTYRVGFNKVLFTFVIFVVLAGSVLLIVIGNFCSKSRKDS